MYAILKNHRGMPVALFDIERETGKRYYGKLVETMQKDNWFWLTGLVRKHGKGHDYVSKVIVMCVINTDIAWHQMKPEMLRIEADHKSRRKLIQAEANRQRMSIREQGDDNDKRAKYEALEEIEKYVIKSALLPL